MKFSILILTISLFVLPFHSNSQNGNYKFRRLDISDGLLNNQVRSIYVDSRGFAWFGTITGLNRFDGYSFKKYLSDPQDSLSIDFSAVYRIREDYTGNLWLFASNNSLCVYNPRNETFQNSHEVFEQKTVVDKDNISEILIDDESNLWLSNNYNGVFFFDRDSKEITKLINVEGDETSLLTNQINDIGKDSKGDIWALNSDGVLEHINHKSFKVTKRIPLNLNLKADGYQSLRLFIDADDDLWVYSESDATGLYFHSIKKNITYRFFNNSNKFRLNSDIITGIEQDEKGIIWVATDHGGINLIDKSNLKTRVLLNELGVDYSLSQNSVTTIFKDVNDIIWVGTYKNGVNYYHPNLFQFGLEKHHPFRKDDLPANDIDCFVEGKDGDLWIGTNGNGLIYYNNRSSSYKLFKHNPQDNNSLSNDVIVSLCMDHEKKLWIGTYYGGLNIYDGKSFKRFMHDPNDPETISDNRIWQIYEDSRHRIWIGTLGGGLDLFDPKTQRFLHFKTGSLNSIGADFVLSLMEHSDGTLWIGTSNGIDLLDPKTGRFKHYSKIVGDTTSLTNDVVLALCEDQRGWIWVGTRDGLSCFDPILEKFRSFNIKDGLADNNILSILSDEEGDIWMSSLNGISNFKIKEGSELYDMVYTIQNFDVLDGLQGKEFNEHSGYKTNSGEMLFGGPNGFNRFHPKDIINDGIACNVVLTDFRLHNQPVAISQEIDGRVLLKNSISFQDEIVLKHHQNVFSIEFASLDFLDPDKVQYKYKLEGFNDSWITTDASNRIATFTNLNPGQYIFKVMAYNDSESDEAIIKIEVIPPIYATNIAIGVYIVLFLLLIFLLIRIIIRREHLKFEREQELMHHERMHELDNMKIRFFTNISHEFRTPLTLILTPLEKLIKNSQDDSVRNQLIIIQRNSRRLLNLVNKLLDFRKMEVKSISINLSYGNIIRFMNETVNTFSDLSESKSIDLNFNTTVDELFTYFDNDKIEKVLFNLLSNAFKFTPPNGLISVTVDCFNRDNIKNQLLGGQPYFELRVADTGIGIRKDKQDVIFERFFQSENSGTIMNQGSGIGLSLVQEFVKLHNGTIHVESEIEQGSTFIVRIPIVTEEKKNTLHESVDEVKIIEDDSIEEQELVVSESDNNSVPKASILIVEDNEDLRFYLKENLHEVYKIIEASNGKEALEIAKRHKPTLIVSDIMMPEMDGIELTKELKSNAITSHIPIILLSARSTNEQKLEGFEAGADDYITKPFNYEILEIKISKLISRRKEFQDSLHLHYEVKPGEIGVTSLDEKFIQKALELVETNISNSEYSVEKLSKDMGVSRGHLYNKLSALTGKTPIEFIRIMRLKRAAQLLGKSQLTVSEIAFDVGFNDPKYFSKYFKEEYGISPSEYAKKAIKSDE